MRLAFIFALLWVIGGSTAFGDDVVRTINISMSPQTPINPLVYGVNYVWHEIPKAEFPGWAEELQGIQGAPAAPVSFVRYPGGWDGEWYDWTNNVLTGGPSYTSPGVSPAQLLGAIEKLSLQAPLSKGWYSTMGTANAASAVSFQLPVHQAVEDKTASDVPTRITQLTSKYKSIIKTYINNVQYWEIGNEWWLQTGAGANTAPLSSNTLLSTNLARYAQLIATIAPVIKAAYPTARLYVTADWRTAGGAAEDDEFVQLRKLVGAAAWADISGISIHPYCGTTVATSLCTSIPKQVQKIRQETGITDIYASEWGVSMSLSVDDYGIRNANAVIAALQGMISGGVSEAAYWPVMNAVPAISLTDGSILNSTGVAFRAMTLIYEGQALPVQIANNGAGAGQTLALAARNNLLGAPGVGVIIASNGDGAETIEIPLTGTGLSRISASSVIYSDDPDVKKTSILSHTTLLPAAISKIAGVPTVQFMLNPGTPGRGGNWEIAVMELQ